MRPRSALAVTLATGLTVALTASCKSKKKQEAEPGAPAAAREEPAPGPSRPLDRKMAGRRASALKRLSLAPITAEEVTPLIPELPGAAPVGKPGSLTGGRQVKAVLCARSSSAKETADQVVAGLEELGFTSVRQRMHPRNADAIAVAGEKPPFRVSASVQRGTYADCSADKGKAKIVFSYFKRGGAAEPEAGGGAAPAQGAAPASGEAAAPGTSPAQAASPAPGRRLAPAKTR